MTELNINENLKKTDLLVEIVKAVNADTYLSGQTGKEYINEKQFKDAGIKLSYQEFKHPVYKQVFDGFVSNLSAIDILFNK